MRNRFYCVIYDERKETLILQTLSQENIKRLPYIYTYVKQRQSYEPIQTYDLATGKYIGELLHLILPHLTHLRNIAACNDNRRYTLHIHVSLINLFSYSDSIPSSFAAAVYKWRSPIGLESGGVSSDVVGLAVVCDVIVVSGVVGVVVLV